MGSLLLPRRDVPSGPGQGACLFVFSLPGNCATSGGHIPNPSHLFPPQTCPSPHSFIWANYFPSLLHKLGAKVLSPFAVQKLSFIHPCSPGSNTSLLRFSPLPALPLPFSAPSSCPPRGWKSHLSKGRFLEPTNQVYKMSFRLPFPHSPLCSFYGPFFEL